MLFFAVRFFTFFEALHPFRLLFIKKLPNYYFVNLIAQLWQIQYQRIFFSYLLFCIRIYNILSPYFF